jgi:hypothetical protein
MSQDRIALMQWGFAKQLLGEVMMAIYLTLAGHATTIPTIATVKMPITNSI